MIRIDGTQPQDLAIQDVAAQGVAAQAVAAQGVAAQGVAACGTHSAPRANEREGVDGLARLSASAAALIPASTGFHDRTGRAISAAPLAVPLNVEGAVLARILSFRHAGFLPVHEFTDHNNKTILLQEEIPSLSLEHLLRECGADRGLPWSELFVDGRQGLVRAFVRFVRLVAAVRGADLEIPLLSPAKLLLSANGVLQMRASDLMSGEDKERSERVLHYAPPDVLVTSGDAKMLTEAGHIYSLAAILYHALTGAPPYPGRNATEIVHRILAGESLRESRWPADLPATLQRYLLDSVSLDPQSRPPSFSAFAGGLEAASAGDPVRSVPYHLLQRAQQDGMRRWLPWIALAALACALFYFLAMGGNARRTNLLSELQAAAFSRPFPAHGEDPPIDDAAPLVLEHWDLTPYRNDPEVQLLRGWAELRSGRNEQALRAFRTVSAHARDHIPAWISSGIARLEMGERAGEEDLDYGLALPAACEEDWLYRGAGLLYLHDFARAIEAFEMVTRLNPNSFPAWLHLAELHHYEGNLAAGRAALDHCLRARPDDLWLTWLDAELLASEGHAENAIRLLEERKSRLLGSPAVLLRCGALLERAGRGEEGKEWVECARAGLFKEAGVELLFTKAGRPVLAERCILPAGPRPAEIPPADDAQ